MNKRLISLTLALALVMTITIILSSGIVVFAENIKIGADDNFKALGNIENLEINKNEVIMTTGPERIKVVFLKDGVFRIWMDPKGSFIDPIEEETDRERKVKIIAKTDYDYVTPEVENMGEYYKISTDEVVLRAYREPLRFAMYDKNNESVIWEEREPLKYDGSKTKQTLKHNNDEHFYGGGLQHGSFSHKDKKIDIELKISHWNDKAVSSPSPFYISTAGYGALRNTFKKGSYDFTEKNEMTHWENRFDAFYFAGDLKEVIDEYTELTGKPRLIPRWGLGIGDADCFNTSSPTYTGTKNKPGKITTPDALEVIKKYKELDIPGAWILPNDGYGCEYTNLKEFTKDANEHGWNVGLWTQRGFDKLPEEVSDMGVRMTKLDVAWVGPGYNFALKATEDVAKGIEDNSDSRAYVWSCCGWAGTQRNSAIWTGDQSGGNYEYIRFHIPTYIGGGLSGMPYVGSDIDGIFGGNAKIHTRDLQWKAFTPVAINMSGWAAEDKQPWVWGEPYTSIKKRKKKKKQKLYIHINHKY